MKTTYDTPMSSTLTSTPVDVTRNVARRVVWSHGFAAIHGAKTNDWPPPLE